MTKSNDETGIDRANEAVTVVDNDFLSRVYENLAWVYEFTFGPALHPGRVDAMFSNLPGVISQHQNKTIRGIGVTSPKRSPAAPEIPAIAESIPGFEVSPWWGLFVQAKTPNEIATKILADAVAALEHPSVRERYEAIGAPVTVSTPAELAARLEKDVTCQPGPNNAKLYSRAVKV